MLCWVVLQIWLCDLEHIFYWKRPATGPLDLASVIAGA
jgi:hypothetical protein